MATKTGKKVNLITGGTSSLGRAIATTLIGRGDEVRVIIRDDPTALPDWKKLPPGTIPYVSDLTFAKRSDEANLKEAAKGVDRVFHIGGATYNSRYTYDQLIDINVIGTQNLLTSIVDSNPDSKKIQFLYASSVTVYGYRRKGEALRETTTAKPGSHYSESKVMAERLIETFCDAHPNIQYTIFRLGTMYGPGYEEPYFFKVFRLIKEGKMKYVGNGDNNLTLVHVADATAGFIAAADNPDRAKNQVFNLTDGKPHTPKITFTLAANYMNVPPPSKHVPKAIARLLSKSANINNDEYEFLTSDRLIDISKIKDYLDFVPTRKLEVDGLYMVQNFMQSLHHVKPNKEEDKR